MITPDILMVWPLHLDYPLNRYLMEKYKDYFRSITIVFSDHHMDVNYSNFIRDTMPFANFVEFENKDKDWRNGAVNAGLDAIPTDGHVLFLEQDFLFTEDFLKIVLKGNPYPVTYFHEGNRIHPAFALVKRILVDETNRDFSAYPDTYGDHFAKFFEELGNGITIDELGAKNRKDYYHLNGLSQEYMNYHNQQPFYNKANFVYYNNECRHLPIRQNPGFLQIENSIAMKFGSPRESFLERFFPDE